jgi:hypothetical protein
MSASSQHPDCGCPAPPFPAPTANPPGQTAIAYRIGDFLAFRRALLQPLAGETQLKDWTPRQDGDLALQMVDWWAYISDVLAFYGERAANETYLRTAQWPESVAHLVATLGYRPRPALGARAQLAGLISPNMRTPVLVPRGTQIQSKPGPNTAPQVFEVDRDTELMAPDLVIADVVPAVSPLTGPDNATLWLAGKVSGIKPAERLLLIARTALNGGPASPFAWIAATSTTSKKDPLGNDVTELAFAIVTGSVDAAMRSGDFVLLRARQSSPLWSYNDTGAVVTTSSVQLAGVARGLNAGALLLIDVGPPKPRRIPRFDLPWELPEGIAPQLGFVFQNEAARIIDPAPQASAARELIQVASTDVRQVEPNLDGELIGLVGKLPPFASTPVIVTSYAEAVWYANGTGPVAPTSDTPPPIGMLSATVGFGTIANASAPDFSLVTARWDWLPVGTIVPVLTPADYTTANSTDLSLDAASKNPFPPGPVKALVEDVNGVGDAATVNGASSASASLANLTQTLMTPIEVMFNLLAASQGKTVATETLGSGDTRVAGQDFTLSKSPVTYFSDPKSVSGDQFSSTVSVSVNGVDWQEARSFYGAGPTDPIFVLREDDRGATHVQFGDGVNGARLPTGVGNVMASYRYGAGGAAPAPETLTTMLAPVPGLKGVRNPLPPVGGVDADAPSRVKALAPASVLTLNRVVSLDDFAATALSAGGVTKAIARFSIDPVSLRPKTTVYAAGDSGAVASARLALLGAGAARNELVVLAATAVRASVTVNYLRDPRYADSDVSQRLRTALGDPDAGLLGANALGIGQVVYDSQIAAIALAVKGVVSVTGINFAPARPRFRFEFILRRQPPALRHDPGAGAYFSVPNDAAHIVLAGSAAP